ncbi:MAG: alpha/beta hydrolase [Desulfobacterales bacterium]|nr:alpha/beta hydrolase [Desulfobacterales bacterium]
MNKRVYITVAAILAALTIAGLFWQFLATRADTRTYPAPGRMVDVGGHRLHVHISGEGPLPVVFETGIGKPYLAWQGVLSEVGRFTRVIAYDRAGLGWSETGPRPRTSSTIVEELRRLLAATGIRGPYILVGHSFGGVNMQLFACRYPESVAGLVLVESSHNDQMERLYTKPLTKRIKRIKRFGLRLAAPLGLTRPFIHEPTPALTAVMRTLKHQYTFLDEVAAFPKSLDQLTAFSPDFKDLPLTVISRNTSAATLSLRKDVPKRLMVWAALQEDLARRSTHATLIFSGKNDHHIHVSQPDLIIDAVRQMVAQVQKTSGATGAAQ